MFVCQVTTPFSPFTIFNVISNTVYIYFYIVQLDPKQLDGQVVSIGNTEELYSFSCGNKVWMKSCYRENVSFSIPYWL